METLALSPNLHNEAFSLLRKLMRAADGVVPQEDSRRVFSLIRDALKSESYVKPYHGLNLVFHTLLTAQILCESIAPDRSMLISIFLFPLVDVGFLTVDDVVRDWGDDIGLLVRSRAKVAGLDGRGSTVKDENYRKLILSFAEDIRVIIIMLVDRLALMREINRHPEEDFVRQISAEVSYLYAPIAHRLGLYKIKSEFEDLSLKYTDREIYNRIARGLNQKKAVRDAYIAAFIGPIKEKLEARGLKFDIKGRTKSIFSIWNKLRKQQIELEGVFDLFAIRIILDVPQADEKAACWAVYSVIADMYTPNPARMKDWISIPKSNGYESLHTTVRGPEGRWVEVQIRSHRMDLVAEKGLAAHWRYKGIKSEGNLDQWMNNIRDILESGTHGADSLEMMKGLKTDIYNKEVFVFTPKGDLFKMPMGATVLDFAFQIHSNVGCTCTGGRVNGRNRKINYKLQSGDTVEIITAASQTPKAGWLDFVVTSKARNKIRLMLNEQQKRGAELGRELLMRRLKNRKIEVNDTSMSRLIKHLGYKTASDFYQALGEEKHDVGDIIAEYEKLDAKESLVETKSAGEFSLHTEEKEEAHKSGSSDVLVIGGGDVKGLKYKLAKCCNPIYGDPVFGFISSEGVVKIHRTDCPNAANIRSKYPYRIISTRWSGATGSQFAATLYIVGHDDIGIVTNITSIINKEPNTSLRSISIDSNDGLFRGWVVVGIENGKSLNDLIKKIKTIKGVKDVQRNK
mgnify:FL=1